MIRQFLSDTKRQSQHLFDVTQYALSQKELSPTRFIIFGRGRSGSTALVSLLNSLPNIHCDGEILNESVTFPYLQVLARCQKSPAQAYGCKILSYQIKRVQPIQHGSLFLRNLYNNGFKIIYLKRDNLVQHAISNIRAKRYGFHRKVTESPLERSRSKKVWIDTDELFRWMKDSEALNQYERLLLSGIPHLKLTYEANLSSARRQQRTVNKICNYLNINSGRATCEFRKVSPKRLADSIANYEEIVRFLARSPYMKYLGQDLLMTSQ